MTPGSRAARDLEAARTLVRMANALAERLGLEVPPDVNPTRGNALDKAMFQREAIAEFLGQVVDALITADPPEATRLTQVPARQSAARRKKAEG